MLRAFFQEDQDIGKIDVLTTLAEEIGLNGKEFKEALETRKYEIAHQQALEYGAQLGINSVPTFIIGDRILPGLLSKENLEREISGVIKGERSQE